MIDSKQRGKLCRMQAALVQASFTTLNSLLIRLDTCPMCLSEIPQKNITLLDKDLLLSQFLLL